MQSNWSAARSARLHANEPFTENALRLEHGLPLRIEYRTPYIIGTIKWDDALDMFTDFNLPKYPKTQLTELQNFRIRFLTGKFSIVSNIHGSKHGGGLWAHLHHIIEPNPRITSPLSSSGLAIWLAVSVSRSGNRPFIRYCPKCRSIGSVLVDSGLTCRLVIEPYMAILLFPAIHLFELHVLLIPRRISLNLKLSLPVSRVYCINELRTWLWRFKSWLNAVVAVEMVYINSQRWLVYKTGAT